MPAIEPLPDLHDWSLISISYDWKASTATFDLECADGLRQLIASGTTDLSVPHSAPWGPSDSINSVERSLMEGSSSFSLRIEMQSGDVISLQAASIELR